MTMDRRDITEFMNWLAKNYGSGSPVLREFLKEYNQGKISFPVKRNLIKGIGWTWKYDWTKLYDAYKNPQVEVPTPDESIAPNVTDEEKTYLGYTPEEIAIGIPDLELERERLNWGQEQDKWQRQLKEREFAQDAADRASETQRMKYEGQLAGYSQWLGNALNPNNLWQPDKADIDAQLEQAWESGRQLSLRDLKVDPYKNWITIGDVQSAKNPFTTQKATTAFVDTERAAEIDTGIKYYESKLKELNDRLKDPTDPLYESPDFMNARKTLKDTISGLKDQKYQAEGGYDWSGGAMTGILTSHPGSTPAGLTNSAAAFYQNPNSPEFAATSSADKITMGNIIGSLTGAAMSSGYRPSVEDKGTLTPSWLKTFSPGLGEYIPRTGAAAEGITPSRQSFNRLAPSQRSMLAGYYERAGQNPADMLWSMDVQTPQTLRLGRTWKPARV